MQDGRVPREAAIQAEAQGRSDCLGNVTAEGGSQLTVFVPPAQLPDPQSVARLLCCQASQVRREAEALSEGGCSTLLNRGLTQRPPLAQPRWCCCQHSAKGIVALHSLHPARRALVPCTPEPWQRMLDARVPRTPSLWLGAEHRPARSQARSPRTRLAPLA